MIAILGNALVFWNFGAGKCRAEEMHDQSLSLNVM